MMLPAAAGSGSLVRTTKFRNCSALSIKIALAFDVVHDLKGCRDTARYRRITQKNCGHNY